MDTVDIVLLALVGVSTLYGAFRGGVKEIFSILAIIGGIAGGIYLHGPMANALGGSDIVHVIGFGVIFLVLAGVLHKLGSVIRTSVRLMFLGSVDRLLGAGIGLLRGIVLVGLIWGLMTAYVDGSKQWIKGSKLSLPVLKGVELVSPVFPESLRDGFEGKYRELKGSWKEMREKAKGVEEVWEKAKGAKEVLERVEELEEKVKGE